MGQLRLVWYLFLAVSFDFSAVTCVTPANVKAIARQFGKMLVEGTADVAVQLEDLQTRYRSSKSLKVTKYDPAAVLEEMRSAVNKYMMDKTDATLRLVESAEGSWKSYNYEEWYNDGCVNNLNSGDDKTCLYHFYSARCNSKYNEDHDGNPIDGCGKCPECFDNRIVLSGLLCLNASSEADCAPNSKFFGKSVSTKSSAVHVPTAVYDRGTDILYKIRWTDPTGDGSGFFDATVQENLKKDPSLTWQFFCSNTGFFRFHPGAPWFFDQDHLDMYDCRLQQWYINAATNPKLMVILLDTSGSMLGQRYEIAKQAIEMIMDTLSENDYFNIIMFNKEPFFVSPCLGERLIQATLRNKRILRYALNDNLKYIEGVASYDKAFRKAFNLLKNYNCTQHYVVNGTSHYNATTCFLEELVETIGFNNDDSDETWPCNKAIMLISDGASDTYETMFKEMNPDKKVRVFSYLIGEEVTEFREVQWMACYNRGFFVHISNLADVQGKIQHYIDIMSRPLAQHKLHTPVWTGIYYDRMFIRPVVERVQYYSKGKGMVKKNLRYVPRTNKGSRLVTTVSAPVLDTYGEEINNHTVLGVMGTSVAVETFQQLAPSYKLGANAYTFMIDNNGYVVFHPQFRPTMNTPQYGEVPKPNYNSIDILEVEVMEEEIDVDNTSRVSVSLEYNRPLRKNFLLGEKGQEGPYASLVLLDNRRRVYKQEVTAYYNGINVTVPFSLGIGVPKGADYRIEVTKTLKELIKAVEEKDFEGSNWRVHPTWVYCVPEADEVNKMDHFRRIVDTMIAERALPAGCSEKDNWLLRQILVDAQVTADVEKTWINNKSRLDSRRGVYLVFLATRSGLTRYVDLNLDDIRYESPFTTVPPPLTTVIRDKNETEQKLEEEPAPALEVEPGYMHFINNHTSSLDELFYQRALRAPTNSYVFDVDTVNRVWKSEPYQSPYGIRENFSILITATTAVYIGGDGSENAAKSPAAVVGFEMLYNSFVEMFLNASDSICKVNNSQHTKCLLVDEHAYIIVTNDLIEYSKPVKLKQPLGLLEPDVMSKLLDNEIFDRVRYIDYQAVCQNETLTSAAYKILSPIFNLLNLITWAWKEFIMLLVEYNIWSLLSGWVLPTEAYTETFRSSFMELGLSCDEISDFFVLNRDSLAARNNFISDTVDFQCRESGTVRCEKTLFASLIPRTNMLLLIIEQPGDCTATDCLNQNVKRNFSERVRSQFVTAYGASDKLYGRETQWRDKTKKLDGQHSTEVVSDSSREMAEKNKPKPPPRCKIGPRFRRAPHRQCVDQHEDVDDLHILCSGGIRHLNLHMLLAFAVFVAVSF